MHDLQWDQLIVEQGAAPPPLSDDRFRVWMSERRIFVSSTMDDEMTPARAAARTAIRRWSGTPEMWEVLAPRDQDPERAFLDGVERSHVFVLMLGHRYGRADETGYSPTHKEANRATELHIPRLLFEPAGVRSTERDGRLNDWVASLHRQISGTAYHDPDDLAARLEARLRELASAQETPWVKLGPLVFPAMVRRQSADGATQVVVAANVRTPALRQAIAALSDWRRAARPNRLTVGVNSWPVEVVAVTIESPTLSSDDVTITCRLPRDRGGSAAALLGGITFNDGGRSIGPSEQVELWAQQAVFGARPPRSGDRFLQAMVGPEGPTLPEILTELGAQGWLAEGLVRLYIVEWLVWKLDGAFAHLAVGPATATGVRVDGGFQPAGHGRPLARLAGVVPLTHRDR